MEITIGSEKQIAWAEKIKRQLLADTDIKNTEIDECIDIDDIDTATLKLFSNAKHQDEIDNAAADAYSERLHP